MTNQQLEQQSRDAVIAYLQDSSVWLEITDKNSIDWSKSFTENFFNLNIYYYRIARPKPWYRVALFEHDNTASADYAEQESRMEQSSDFIKWLTDRIPYDS